MLSADCIYLFLFRTSSSSLLAKKSGVRCTPTVHCSCVNGHWCDGLTIFVRAIKDLLTHVVTYRSINNLESEIRSLLIQSFVDASILTM
jgi:hypothetical protein